MEAAAIPLPNPETTPPVTKMYLQLIGHASGWREFSDNARPRPRRGPGCLLAGRVVLAVGKIRIRARTQLTNDLRDHSCLASSCSTRPPASGRSTPWCGLLV